VCFLLGGLPELSQARDLTVQINPVELRYRSLDVSELTARISPDGLLGRRDL